MLADREAFPTRIYMFPESFSCICLLRRIPSTWSLKVGFEIRIVLIIYLMSEEIENRQEAEMKGPVYSPSIFMSFEGVTECSLFVGEACEPSVEEGR